MKRLQQPLKRPKLPQSLGRQPPIDAEASFKLVGAEAASKPMTEIVLKEADVAPEPVAKAVPVEMETGLVATEDAPIELKPPL